MLDNIIRQFEILFIAHIYSIFGAVAFIILAILFSYWIGIIIRFALRKYIEKSIVDAAVRASRITIVILTIITILSEFDINITSLIAGFGIFGFALAIGLRPLTTNFFTGIVLHAAKPIEEGDYIESDEARGVVETVHWFHTIIITDDGTYVSVPNGPLWAKSIKNFSRPAPKKIGLEITVGTEPGFRDTKGLLKNILTSGKGLRSEFEPTITVKDSDTKRIVIETASWYLPDTYWEARETLANTVGESLAGAGVNVVEVKHLSVSAPGKTIRKRISKAKRADKTATA